MRILAVRPVTDFSQASDMYSGLVKATEINSRQFTKKRGLTRLFT